jgi:tetrahydrodipicolinate N-succinyltransferase
VGVGVTVGVRVIVGVRVMVGVAAGVGAVLQAASNANAKIDMLKIYFRRIISLT